MLGQQWFTFTAGSITFQIHNTSDPGHNISGSDTHDDLRLREDAEDGVQGHVLRHRLTSYYITLYYITLHYITLRYDILYYIMLYYVILYHVLLYGCLA